ncbi:hydrolase [Enterococcus saigonensis]|uniref:Hydrolase n=1 Tax=Enterococcus saigonensis TaxID=1805431 RepID=A0A679ILI5_9ENTE|nr:HAD family hydrolase [Enterococcus saigonensis]BCA86136.1 hydrolase [Enterococcus saigonensis]
MIKLIISDLDGTFLNSQSNFDEKLYQEVRQIMHRQNVVFAPCTGKQCERVEDLFKNVGSEDLWILGDSATRIKHQGSYLYESLLPNEIGKKIISKLQSIHEDLTIIACTQKAAIISVDTSIDNEKMVRGSYKVVEKTTDYQNITTDFVKITVYDKKLRSYEVTPQLAEFKEQAYIVASEGAWIDITNFGVHKRHTVEKLQQILNVTPQETMVFGDGHNDLELMQAGTFSFAMRNAFEETKDFANYICRSNDENGVLLTIRQLLSLQEKH